MKKLLTLLALGLSLSFGAAHAADAEAACGEKATEKKLAGAAIAAHIKKCTADEIVGPQPAASTPKK